MTDDRHLRPVSPVGAVDPQEAAVEAWGFLAVACDRALAVPGLDVEDVDDLREIRQCAAEVAGIPTVRVADANPKGAA